MLLLRVAFSRINNKGKIGERGKCVCKKLHGTQTPQTVYSLSDWFFPLGPEPKPEFKGEDRTFRLWLDTNQYQQDMAETVHGAEVTILWSLRRQTHVFRL